MELRSRRIISGPSSQGNSVQPRDVSDEQDRVSDSDFDGIICADSEDSSSTIEENKKRQVFEANDLSIVREDDGSDNYSSGRVKKRRKVGKGRRKGRQRCKREEMRGAAKEEELGNAQDLEVREDEQVSDINIIGLQSGRVDYDGSKKHAKKRKKKGASKPMLMWKIWKEEDEKWIDMNLTEDVDLDHQSEVVAETADAPSDLIMPLLRYQKEWLAWALKQEEMTTRGGILADEMGMGKTIQAIALVLAKREITQKNCEPKDLHSPGSSKDLPKIKGTLVICPVVAVLQWVNEIGRFTTTGSTKVLVYHGANRGKSVAHFSEYDFVITTYSIVEAEYRKNMMPPKQKCVFCGKLFYPQKMSIHLKYFCGPDAIKTDKQSKQKKKESKLELKKLDFVDDKGVECEGEKLSQSQRKYWEKYMRKNSVGFRRSLMNSAVDEQGTGTRKSSLHSVRWDRIILDEAHFIKDRRCNTAKAVLALESEYKWALSGTPLQNRVGELYSLIRYLRVIPYSYYFCKDCDCRTLDYSPSTACSNCEHKSVRHFCWWNKNVATPIQEVGNIGGGQRAMILLKHKILKSILLRRTKKGRAADLALPPRIVSLRRDTLDIKEEDYYQTLYNESQAQFNTYVEAGTLLNNYAHIFDLLTRLRQAVDHPYLVVYSRTSNLMTGNIVDADNSEQMCGICNDPLEDPVVTSCAHVFCKACLIDFSSTLGQVSCPSCSKPLTVDLTTRTNPGDRDLKTTLKGFKPSSILNRIRLDDFQTSTKIDALREEIRFMVENDGSAKGIVFSQFTSFLDLINYSLQKSGITCVQLVGSMSMTARDAAISRFTNDPDCKIFLMSLKAGGVALNLTVASHVFLMDPWWNPAVERQAQDRIHRIGQYKPIRIVRFIIEKTIEERILKLQEKKELVFEGTVGGSSEALGKLTEEDLKFLFIT